MSEIMQRVFNYGNDFLNWVEGKSTFLANFLPLSPFRRSIDRIHSIPYIEAINWIVPIDEIILIMFYWGTAIAVYYAYMIVLRWVKAIE